MIIRKPTTIALKPEDDYTEYEEFKARQEAQKKQQIKKEPFGWQIPPTASQLNQQAPKNARRSIQAQEPMEFTTDTIWDSQFHQRDQIPVNQLFRMLLPQSEQEQQP